MVIPRPVLVLVWALLPVVHLWTLWPLPLWVAVAFCLLWYRVGPLVHSLGKGSGSYPSV